MLKLAANLTLLFTEVPFEQRFAAAEAAGFRYVECQFPYGHDPNVLSRLLARHHLDLVLHNLPAGDWASGARGIACHPDRVAECRAGVALGLQYAAALGCARLNCLAGVVPEGVTESDATQTFVENLWYAAPICARAGVKLLIEAINRQDVPGFLLSSTRQARDIIDRAGSDNIFIQYDAYHMHIMEGEALETLAMFWDRIAHIQVADAPGRHEPGTGEIDFRTLFEFLSRKRYAGYIGCEYIPAGATVDGLGWMGHVQCREDPGRPEDQ